MTTHIHKHTWPCLVTVLRGTLGENETTVINALVNETGARLSLKLVSVIDSRIRLTIPAE
jgi:hypothetical protein